MASIMRNIMKTLQEFIFASKALRMYREYMKLVYSFEDPKFRIELHSLYYSDFKGLIDSMDSSLYSNLDYAIRVLEGNLRRSYRLK